jgi:integrase
MSRNTYHLSSERKSCGRRSLYSEDGAGFTKFGMTCSPPNNFRSRLTSVCKSATLLGVSSMSFRGFGRTKQVRRSRSAYMNPAVRTVLRVADSYRWTKKTYNNAVSALQRAFNFGFHDHPECPDPAKGLKSARVNTKNRPKIDPFSIQDAETLIAALHRDWGEAQGNYAEFRFFTGLRLSERIALVVTDYDAVNGMLSVTKARVANIDRDRTKIAEDRRIVLNARAQSVLERQLAPRVALVGGCSRRATISTSKA